MKERILIVDDDPLFLMAAQKTLKAGGYDIQTAEQGNKALDKAKDQDFDLVLTDLNMEGMSGLDLLKELKKLDPFIEVVMITGEASLGTAVEAMRLGASDYIQKPWDQKNQELQVRIRKALDTRQTVLDRNRLKQELHDKYEYKNIIGEHPKMKYVFELIEKVANSDVTILILGETGTGKEVIARAIHYHSIRKDKPFVVVNCPAYSENLLESELFGHEKGSFTGAFKQKIGRFEMASEGSVFIDEIGDVSSSIQAKLLRFLQEKEFERVGGNDVIKSDARIIAATNRDLKKMVDAEKFRMDLFYRLNVFPIELPPLRERKEDIPFLVNHFLTIANPRFKKNITTIKPEVIETLMSYDWPGNIRELQHVIDRAVLLETSGALTHILLPSHVKRMDVEKKAAIVVASDRFPTYNEYANPLIAGIEKDYFQELLTFTRGNISLAAEQAGLNRNTIMRRMSDYGLDKMEFKSSKGDLEEPSEK